MVVKGEVLLVLGACWLGAVGATGCEEKSHNINLSPTARLDTRGGGADGGGTQDASTSWADGSYTVVDGVIVSQDALTSADGGPAPAPGALGAACSSSGDCAGGYCFQGPDGRVCTETCEGDCPEGYRCRAVSVVDADLCVPLARSGCRPCAGDFQCPGGACLTVDGEARCAPVCETDDDCLAGALCGADPAGQREGAFCLPASGSCSCDASVAGGVRTCQVSNEQGTCPGLETCDPEAGWVGCSAPTPAAEVCNGLDDDCDGLVDDALPDTQPCEVAGDGEGLGTCQGEARCVGAGGWVCDAPAPTAEVCDGADNDCDGQTDEDFRDAQGFWTLDAHCGGCGVDCASAFPHGQGMCGGTPDAPVCVVASCEPGYWPINDGGCVAMPEMSCQPCLTDADCLGGTCADLEGERACLMPCGEGEEPCPQGTTCQPAPLDAGEPPGEPASGPERCVPITGSCSCDEAAASQGLSRPCALDSELGHCMGTQLCEWPGGWGVCSGQMPAAEICNGLDDDCDGLTDEGLTPPEEPCVNTGAEGSCQGTWTCADTNDGQGVHWVCDAPAPLVETCNGLDDDCNGQTDEGFGQALGGLHAPCVVGQGVCQNVGEVVCSADTTGAVCSVQPKPSMLERCNGLDDDCDGLTDEDFLTGPEALGSPCTVGQGMCTASGVWTCEGYGPGAPQDSKAVCSVQPKPSMQELCNGLDDDCDGLTDELFPTLGQLCQLGLGACQRFGQTICAADGDNTTCDATPGNPNAEQCNGLDDDCDGLTDEELTAPLCPLQAGVCQGAAAGCKGDQGWGPCDEGLYATWSEGSYEAKERTCDGLDNDCNGVVDDVDVDGDGHLDSLCVAYMGSLPRDDCNDSDPMVHPGAPEICGDGLDNDCSGFVDDKDLDGDLHVDAACPMNQDPSRPADDCDDAAYLVNPDSTDGCDGLDNDCDGIVDDVDLDGDGFVAGDCSTYNGDPKLGGDCNDDPMVGGASVYPGAPETCQGQGAYRDDDCNGVIDDRDMDRDGHIDPLCVAYTGSLPRDDCDDSDPMVHPGAPEICGDYLDNDCTGYMDDKDLDRDGHIDPLCVAYTGSLPRDDCDDSDPMVHPGAPEICGDYLDNDCNGEVDDRDLDGDGHIDAACTGYVGSLPIDDCADLDPWVHPGAPEKCGDGVDQDCTGHEDDKDADADGHIDASALCAVDPGSLKPRDDCNDEAMESYLGAPEGTQPDLLDNDCNGLVDDGLVQPGDAVITELMIDPAAVPDTQGEWIEVYNTTSHDLNLASWTLTDGASETFSITSKGAVILPAGGYAVLCSLAEWDYNGGVSCDFEYANFTLSQVQDTVTLQLGSTVIDTVSYDTAQGAWVVPSGASLQLDPGQLDATSNDSASAWCASDVSTVLLPGGDLASPKAAGVGCGGGSSGYLEAVVPDNGIVAGTEPVKISGMGLAGATGATFGGFDCVNFQVVDDSTVACETPAGAVAGPVDVVVLHPGGNLLLSNGYTYTEVAQDTPVDWCNLQAPPTTTGTQYSFTEFIYGRVHFSDGTIPPTDPPSPPSFRAEVGFGAHGSDPAATAGWSWMMATENTSCSGCNNNYEYMGQLVPEVTGTFSYAYRFSTDGGISWSYCDLDGSTTGQVETAQLGTLTVSP